MTMASLCWAQSRLFSHVECLNINFHCNQLSPSKGRMGDMVKGLIGITTKSSNLELGLVIIQIVTTTDIDLS